jgi:hypothetical protein
MTVRTWLQKPASLDEFRHPDLSPKVWGPHGFPFNQHYGCFPRVRRPEREAHQSAPFRADVKNEWSYTSSFMTPTGESFQDGYRKSSLKLLFLTRDVPMFKHWLVTDYRDLSSYWFSLDHLYKCRENILKLHQLCFLQHIAKFIIRQTSVRRYKEVASDIHSVIKQTINK